VARLIRLASAARTLARCRRAYALQRLGQQRPSMRWPQKPAVVQAADDLSVHHGHRRVRERHPTRSIAGAGAQQSR